MRAMIEANTLTVAENDHTCIIINPMKENDRQIKLNAKLDLFLQNILPTS